MQVIDIPLLMRRNVVDVWAADRELWLATLPSLTQELADTWGLQIHGPASTLSFHWVASTTREDGSSAVLKIDPTEPRHLAVEAAASTPTPAMGPCGCWPKTRNAARCCRSAPHRDVCRTLVP